MLQRLIVVFLFALVCHSSFASCPAPAPPDSGGYKITEQQFLDRYGGTDNARQFIHYFFDNRNAAKKLLIIFGGVATLGGLLVLIAANTATDGNHFGLLLLSILLGVTGIFLLIGALSFVRYSRKRLLKRLQYPEKIPQMKNNEPYREPRPKPFTKKK